MLLSSAEAWKYKPFAVARIKELRAVGITHAAQRFFVDGFVISVRLVGPQSFISIEGSCVLAVDTGVADTFFVGGPAMFDIPQNFERGTLYHGTEDGAYIAGFTQVSDDGKYKTNPGETNQFAGTLTGLRGRIRADAYTDAFYPGKIKDEEGELIDDPKDANLLMKKLMVKTCPASVFTGRCRLYVQAMYGRPLYSSASNKTLATEYLTLANKTFQYQPVLRVKNEKKDDEGKDVYVDINTSTGVYLDKVTGRHWMFNLSDGSWSVYPLIASECGEALRKYLKSDDDHGMSEDDKRHLETYVLSSCRPIASKMQSAPFTGTIPYGLSMGYGWHWNYSGTKADIAVNEIIEGTLIDPGRVNRAMRSTHFSVSVMIVRTPDEDETKEQQHWTATLTTVAKPSTWSVDRGLWCLCFPNGENLEKMTPMRTNSMSGEMCAPGEGTFYVYYKGDELQTCVITVSYTSATFMYAPTPTLYIPTKNGAGSVLQRGPSTGAYFSVSITCAGVSSGALPSLSVNTGGKRITVSGAAGTLVGPYYSVYFPAVDYPFPEGQGLNPRDAPSQIYNQVVVPNCIGYRYPVGHTGYAPKTTTDSLVIQDWGRATVTTPHGDSESCFLSWKVGHQEDTGGSKTHGMYIGMFGGSIPIIVPGIDLGPIFHWAFYEAISQPAGALMYTTPAETTTSESGSFKFVGRTGIIDAPLVESYHNAILHTTAEDEVFIRMPVVSGTTDNTVVLAKDILPPQNCEAVAKPSLIGCI